MGFLMVICYYDAIMGSFIKVEIRLDEVKARDLSVMNADSLYR